jgi:hypothetical protein
MHVSARTVADAAKVRAKGVPELVKRVEQGEVAVSVSASVSLSAWFTPHCSAVGRFR